MPISLAPAMNLTPVGLAANVTGREDRRRFDVQQDLRTRQVDLQEAELRQREKLTFADMAFKEAMQQQNFAEAAKARQFGLDAQKELDNLRYAENQKAREFDFGARQALQDDQQQYGYQTQYNDMAFRDYSQQQQIAANQWSQMAQQAAREREAAAQIAAQQQRDLFNHYSGMQRQGYGAYLNEQSAQSAFGRQQELLPIQTQQSLDLYGGQLDLRQQQEQAKMQQQLALIDQAERAGQIDANTAQQMRMQVQLQGSGAAVPRKPGDYLPIIDPTTNQPLRDPATGLPLLRDPYTGEPVNLPARAAPQTKPVDNTSTINSIANSIFGSQQPGKKDYAAAWAQAQAIINGQSNPSAGLPGGGVQNPGTPFNVNNPSGDTSGNPGLFTGGNMPRVFSAADYAALPSGTQYIDPNGNVRVKP